MSPPGSAVPMPDPLGDTAFDQPAEPPAEPEQPSRTGPADDGGVANPRVDPDTPVPEVVYDLGKLPEPVRRMHDLIVEACKSGDIEKLRPLIGTGDTHDPIVAGRHRRRRRSPSSRGFPATRKARKSWPSWKRCSMPAMSMSMPARRKSSMSGRISSRCRWTSSTPSSGSSCSRSSPPATIDDMKQFGAYIFYRVGITPAGQWTFFVAGD